MTYSGLEIDQPSNKVAKLLEDGIDTNDSHYGEVYYKTLTMADDNATRFEATATNLRYVKIKVTTNDMVFGDSTGQTFTVAADEDIELAKVDISTLYFKNAAAGSNGVVTALGVKE